MASAAIFVGVLGVVTLTSMGDLLVSQLKGDIKEKDTAYAGGIRFGAQRGPT